MHLPIIFAVVIWKPELGFYFRFVKIDHFRFGLNGVRAKVLPRGVRGGDPCPETLPPKEMLRMETGFPMMGYLLVMEP